MNPIALFSLYHSLITRKQSCYIFLQQLQTKRQLSGQAYEISHLLLSNFMVINV